MNNITIELSAEMIKELNKVCKTENILIDDFVQQSLQRTITKYRFRKLRKMVFPFAEQIAINSDEEVFKLMKEK